MSAFYLSAASGHSDQRQQRRLQRYNSISDVALRVCGRWAAQRSRICVRTVDSGRAELVGGGELVLLCRLAVAARARRLLQSAPLCTPLPTCCCCCCSRRTPLPCLCPLNRVWFVPSCSSSDSDSSRSSSDGSAGSRQGSERETQTQQHIRSELAPQLDHTRCLLKVSSCALAHSETDLHARFQREPPRAAVRPLRGAAIDS